MPRKPKPIPAQMPLLELATKTAPGVPAIRKVVSKANILPEQTIGRGLRLMFRGRAGDPTFKERVDIIGNGAFIQFVEQLERDEEIEFETVDLNRDRIVIETIFPDPDKLAYDIIIPVLSPILTGTEWGYKKVLQKEFEQLRPSEFDDLIALEPITVL